ALLQQLDALPPDVAFMRVESHAGRSWALHCLGRPAEARDGLRVAVEWAIEADEPVSALYGLVEACRLGDGKWAADQLDRVTALSEVEGPLATAQQALVRACGGRLGGPYLAAARAFAACDAHLLAAESAMLAAVAFIREGQRREGSEGRAVAAAALAKCDAAATPALQAGQSLVSPLSAREAEVARLAAHGLTSKEVAERLYLSTRTVENHLQRVYTKLGVSGRDDLQHVLF
ncbi:MAG: helix-turn-helix transcriptional regulator, partial [Ilumatobacteraceae bacterium]